MNVVPVFCGVRVAHLLLLLGMYGFSYSMFFVVYVCFPCLVFVSGLHSFDYLYSIGSLDTWQCKKKYSFHRIQISKYQGGNFRLLIVS